MLIWLRFQLLKRGPCLFGLSLFLLRQTAVVSEPPRPAAAPRTMWLQATAYAIPEETAPEGEGYFVTTTRHVILGVCPSHVGNIYILALGPYSLLQVGPAEIDS
jgi:hypothetical protein